MRTVSAMDMRKRLGEILDAASAGERILIERDHRPLAYLISVEDAQRLAQKHGNDPALWSDVAYWLIQKSKRAVYNDPVVKYGFARGTEPVAYVDVILDRFEDYKAFVRADPSSPAVAPAAAMRQ